MWKAKHLESGVVFAVKEMRVESESALVDLLYTLPSFLYYYPDFFI